MDYNHRPTWIAQTPVGRDASCRISSVLIANRGEIACRVIATCLKLQIRTIAVYAEEDAVSQHVMEADEAICLGSMEQPGGNPFLNIQLLVKIAKDSKADGIHPGYGYLSENPDFADAVRASGIVFLGPSSSAIKTLGDKRQAKEYLREHLPSVPLIPGYTGSSEKGVQSEELAQEASKIGYPVMIKASAGGGGRGLRVVHRCEDLEAEFQRAQSEAERSFGLGDCILEKYIEQGKHVEVQILGDSHGKVIALWERDCSVQRRHQKIIEESPCVWLSKDQREAICATAVQIGELLRYEGAGTVEFILDLKSGSFYFLEVNARLQVEHPITEEITGLDIVALQIFVAAGGNLAKEPKLQQIPQMGHSIECRLCAEDPQRGFTPQHGPVLLWETPTNHTNVRVETAIKSGARISIHFDSMIAKIVVWAPSRALAIKEMAQALAETVCVGVSTNQAFLRSCLLHKDFENGDYSTSFIPSNLESLLSRGLPSDLGLPPDVLSIVPSVVLRHIRRQRKREIDGTFSTIRPSFRNQRFDKVNTPADVICVHENGREKPSPQICLWNFDTPSLSGVQIARIAPLSHNTAELEKTVQEEKNPSAVTKAYNNLSNAIRAGNLPGSIQCSTKIHSLKVKGPESSPESPSHVCRIEVSLDGTKLLAHVVIEGNLTESTEPDTADFVRIFCHFPTYGYPVEYRYYSLLSYYESQRIAILGGGDEADLGIIKAPMPCKVLQILKGDKEEVKVGDLVMIIESMKMEITISATQAGLFKAAAKEGEAVAENSKLCSFIQP
ncbi:hypothetical protein FSARC_1132 [Fusarium sarcochroum]|uniref:Biotin carboxylase n=1 Tax=Fusarium sarcochroum TaxID=1208366 RepID=A0A8H4U9U8_9HYPO|nr:hypothetical protein FSARC_1132 [Fusarium sarcochroum]